MEKGEYEIMYQVEENHFWYQGLRKITEAVLIKFLPKLTTSKIKILDAGCGTGGSLLFLNKFGSVVGCDTSKSALAFCKKRGLTNVRYGSIDNLPFNNHLFDLVTCFDVLGQKEVRSDQKAISEFYRVLKPGGLLLVRVAAYNWLHSYHDIRVHTRHRYTTRKIERLIKAANLLPLKISYVNSFLFPAILVRRIFKGIIGKNLVNSDVQPVDPILNRLLLAPLALESFLIRFFNFPFGLSVIAVASK